MAGKEEGLPFAVADHISDVVFVVEDKEIHFTKLFLYACSPVFDRMFRGEFAEKTSKVIPLPGKRYYDMVTFLKLIHPEYAHSTPITDNYLLSLLDLCREYQVESVRNKCEQYMGAEIDARAFRKLTADRVLLYIYACDQHQLLNHLPLLKTIAVDERKTEEVKNSYNFKAFSSTPSFVEALLDRCGRVEKIISDVKRVIPLCDLRVVGVDSHCTCYDDMSRKCWYCVNISRRCDYEAMLNELKKINI